MKTRAPFFVERRNGAAIGRRCAVGAFRFAMILETEIALPLKPEKPGGFSQVCDGRALLKRLAYLRHFFAGITLCFSQCCDTLRFCETASTL
jgi:hypothetical protein